MKYVLDNDSFNVLKHFFPGRFKSFWQNFNEAVDEGLIVSVREVLNELEGYGKLDHQHIQGWVKANKSIFLVPTAEAMKVVTDIFKIKHFQQLIAPKKITGGKPVADPFVIGMAKAHNAYVVTEEKFKKNSAKIPTICRHFKVKCTNLEGMMELEGWEY